jgi:AcrR family transcriptional regulator
MESFDCYCIQMPEGVKGSRRYRSPARQQQAENTRRRVLEAAHRLFLDRGYAGTTVAAVAAEAEVSPETIYGSLGGKRGLLEGVIAAAVQGPDDAVPFEELPRYQQIAQLGSPRERLVGLVDFICDVLSRTSLVHAVIRGAADAEPFAVDLRDRQLEERLQRITKRVRTDLKGALRPGLSPARAAQQLAAILSPELHHLVTVQMGWSAEQHREWVTRLATTELLNQPD